MAEWSNAAVLKTVDPKDPGVRIPPSPPPCNHKPLHTIKDARIKKTLDRLHTEAAAQRLTLVKGLVKGLFRKLKPEDMQDAYIPISRQQGEFLYDLLLREEAIHIVEFGTSFGISTIYLAAAAKQTNGKVITTEILPNKCQVAKHNFREAGLEKWIELREGDAMETLTGINARN